MSAALLVNIDVDDLEKAVAFYRDGLGLAVGRRLGMAVADVVQHRRGVRLHLAFLGDVFATPQWFPLYNVFSVGDVLMLLGVFLAIHAASGSRLVGTSRTRLQRSQESPAAR